MCLNEDQTNGIFQKSPKLLRNIKDCFQCLSISDYRTAKSFVEVLRRKGSDEKDHKTIHQWCYEEYKMTYNTLVMDIKITQILSEYKIDEQDIKLEKSVKTFQKRFVKSEELSEGFGFVVKVEDLNTRTLFAIKRIKLKGNH